MKLWILIFLKVNVIILDLQKDIKNNKICIIGMPGSGKTKYGKKLAKYLNFDFIDLDEYIIQKKGKSIALIFEEEGALSFRNIESICLKELLEKEKKLVISCGGGTPAFNENMELINNNSLSIYLKLPIAFILHRVKKSNHRPLLNNKNELENTLINIYNTRYPFYEKADITLTNYDNQWYSLKEIFSHLKNKTNE